MIFLIVVGGGRVVFIIVRIGIYLLTKSECFFPRGVQAKEFFARHVFEPVLVLFSRVFDCACDFAPQNWGPQICFSPGFLPTSNLSVASDSKMGDGMFDPADMELDMVDEVHGSLFSTVSFPVLIFFLFSPLSH